MPSFDHALVFHHVGHEGPERDLIEVETLGGSLWLTINPRRALLEAPQVTVFLSEGAAQRLLGNLQQKLEQYRQVQAVHQEATV